MQIYLENMWTQSRYYYTNKIIAYILLLTFVTSHSLFDLFVLHLFISSIMIPLLLSFCTHIFGYFQISSHLCFYQNYFVSLLPSYCVYV